MTRTASYSVVRGADGTRLRAWTNGGDGPAVVISNGMGSSPAAWPTIAAPDSGFRVVTWSYRGLGGSDRPSDPAAIRVADHAADLAAVMDAAEMARALVVSWSIGVNVAFELAQHQPERVAGVLAVAGVPGGSLKAMFGPLGLPSPWREPAGVMSANMLRVTGPLLSMLVAGLPRGHHPVSRSGGRAVAREAAQLGALGAVLRDFAKHDWDWYCRLVLAAGEHEPMDLSTLRCPVTMIAGRHDAISSSDDMRAVGRTIPGARIAVLGAGTHLVPLQYPQLMLDELRLLDKRSIDADASPT